MTKCSIHLSATLMKIKSSFPRRRSLYDRYLDGKVYELTRGKDFIADAWNWRSACYRRAKALGKSVRVSISRDGHTIIVQATEGVASAAS